MKKYSIISVVNNSYVKFAYVFVKSALENLNLEHIHEICLLDTGLEIEHKNKLSQLNDKVKIISTESKLNSLESWDKGWQENVLLKTNFAYNYLVDNRIPTCMIDIDSMIIKDLYEGIDVNADAIICDRSDLWGGMPLIASFVGFVNVDKSLNFIELWRDKMNYMLDKGFKTRETPALNEIVRENKEFKLLGASHKIVGLYKQDLEIDNTKIIHFKGAGDSEGKPMAEAINIRLNRFNKYGNKIKEYLEDV